MTILFVVGAMNLPWWRGLATLVLVEKLFPSGVWIARIGGVLLVAWGARWLTRG
jgi:predicted metal-binding membrane protein